MKFTKGEWKVNHKLSVQVEPENPIRTLTICQVYGGDEESKSNAKLIAAAPDLLESIIDLLDHYEFLVLSGDAGWWNPDEENVVISAQTAIKKATEL